MEAFTHSCTALCSTALVKSLLVFSPARCTSKLEPVNDQYKLLCMSSQYITDNISASSSASSAIFIHMNIHVHYKQLRQSHPIPTQRVCESTTLRLCMARVNKVSYSLPVIHTCIHKWNTPHLPPLLSRGRASPRYSFFVPLRLRG